MHPQRCRFRTLGFATSEQCDDVRLAASLALETAVVYDAQDHAMILIFYDGVRFYEQARIKSTQI